MSGVTLTLLFESKVFKGGQDGISAGPNFTTQHPQRLNEDMQVGDTMFYVPTTSLNGFGTANLSDVVKLGEIINISEKIKIGTQDLHMSATHKQGANAYQEQYLQTKIDVEWDSLNVPQPTIDAFFFFQKSPVVNSTSLVGYYADVKFVNNSNKKAELFSVGSEIAESSR
tara:strand:- start:2280 stop:2789 length:510 start_codon:yes stop_codon:yes gene_type:complete